MALIVIRRRKEPIEIENARAQRIKERWVGTDTVAKAEPDELLDLGEWAGKYSQIESIEMTRPKRVEVVKDPLAEEKAEHARLLAMKIEDRVDAIGFGMFKITWWMRSGRQPAHKEPPKEVMDFAKRYALTYLKAHPTETSIPSNVYTELLVKHWGAREPSLADKMRVVHSDDENKG